MANLSFIKKSLPWLGAIAGIVVPGAAPLIGIASSILGAKLGQAVTPTADGIANVLETALGTPAQHAALLDAEHAFQQAMQQMNYQHESDMEAIAERDRESARTMQVQTKSWIPGFLAVGVTIGFFGLLALIVFRPPPAASAAMLNIMLGALATAWVAIVMFYFGSSAGSARKTELLSTGT